MSAAWSCDSRDVDRHPPCPCGLNLADECDCGRVGPLGSLRVVPPVGVADVYRIDEQESRATAATLDRLRRGARCPRDCAPVSARPGVFTDWAGDLHAHRIDEQESQR